MKTPSAGHYGRGSRASDTSPDSRIFIPSITSQEILDENAQSHNRFRSQPRRTMNRKVVVVAVVVVLAVIGAIVAVVVTKSDSSTSASNSSGGSGASNSTSTSDSKSSSKTSTSGTSGNSTTSSGSSKNAKVKTDPKADTYSLSVFAIGDWGQTLTANDSCCTRRKGVYNGYDWHAEAGVAKLMDIEAETNKPAVVISHGDNFYWTGIEGDSDQKYRFESTFEARHRVESMGDVPWVNVMGNHDYGGGSYICVDGEKRVACSSGADLVANLKKRFAWQQSYVSPNNNRWKLTDHFYKYTVTKGDVSMDIFNLDMNDAESHGANEICCQCYDYAAGDDKVCKTITRGGEKCCGGDTDMYDACIKQFNEWGDEALSKIVTEVKKSTATWKVVNSHYSPYGHYGETSGKKWLETLNGLGVQLWVAGHTHGEKHDYASFGMHFIENGAGGGIQSESASGIPQWASGLSNLWTAAGFNDGGNTYGFFSLEASTAWLKVRFLTFDDKWSLSTKDAGSTFGQSTTGGVAAKWCYYIPVDGTEGQAC